MSVPILIDMNLSPEWVAELARHGWTAVHWSPIGDPRAEDSTLMAWALANGHVVFTHDLDFGMLPGAMKTNSPSVVQMRCQDVLPAAVGDMVVRAILIAEPHLKAGALVTVDSRRHRIRLLPI